MEKIKVQSLSESVFERIEQGILSGEYPVGSYLTENGLSKSLEVSRTPIREAISRLTQENLIKETPKGHLVVGVSTSDIVDIYDVRAKIEGVATARCAKSITDEELARLGETVELQEFYTLKGEPEKIKGTDNDFHQTIYNVCGGIYRDILSALHKKAQRYRKLSFSDGDRAAQAVREHKEIYAALRAHDEALCEALAVKHILNAKISIIAKKEN